jgi:hypothetical protein
MRRARGLIAARAEINSQTLAAFLKGVSMNEAFEEFYRGILQVVSQLIILDPPSESPEGHLLSELAAALEEYEKANGWDKL